MFFDRNHRYHRVFFQGRAESMGMGVHNGPTAMGRLEVEPCDRETCLQNFTA
ncbi:hypothetical protein [Hallella bergensis]|uniref:hypothetical protein n=1 Tax=Hallella bergensis TaxID=242750 RepID=UPI003990C2E5